jgi:cyclopropane fatty-acyl-phospholipid synthase-like methyltransferase
MSKYNFDLDMESNNSNSVILRNIKSNSSVLEIGCAHGRMTKYLKEQLNCEITIVEIDEEAGTEASKCGFIVNEEFNLPCAVEHTELKNSYNDVSKEVEEAMKLREDHDIYQYVWELK